MTDARDHVAIKLDLIGDTLYLVILGAAYPYRSTTATVTKVTKCYVTYRKADQQTDSDRSVEAKQDWNRTIAYTSEIHRVTVPGG